MTLHGERRLFVYYRIDAADEPAARSLVRGFQAGLASSRPGLQSGLLVRVEQQVDSQRTFMETYARSGHPGGVDTECQAAIGAAAAALAPLLRSPRHAEVFCEPGD